MSEDLLVCLAYVRGTLLWGASYIYQRMPPLESFMSKDVIGESYAKDMIVLHMS
jgi:hypothetical protein